MTEPHPLFVDIDGTLTSTPEVGWGAAIPERIDHVKRLIASGRSVVLWSGRGTAYARAFAERHGIAALAVIGKPAICVDDNPTIRPEGSIRVVAPEVFFA